MKTAMILAAGRGERLRPFTNFIPKALCEIGGIPLIEYHIINLARAGVETIIINHAYLGGKLKAYLGNGKRWGITIEYCSEPPGGLETGGGILNALPHFEQEPFIVVNADIYTTFDFASFKIPNHSLAHLVLGENPAHNVKGDFGLVNNILITSPPSYTFLGIAYYRPQLFETQPFGRFGVIKLVKQAMNARETKITGELFTGAWHDIGTLERLNKANNPFRN